MKSPDLRDGFAVEPQSPMGKGRSIQHSRDRLACQQNRTVGRKMLFEFVNHIFESNAVMKAFVEEDELVGHPPALLADSSRIALQTG